MPDSREVHRTTSLVLSVTMAILGLVMLVTTISSGGGPFSIGVLMGVMFVAAGGGRAYFSRRAG